MNIIRQYKLYRLGILSDSNIIGLINFLDNTFKGLSNEESGLNKFYCKINTEKYNYYTQSSYYFNKDKKCICSMNDKLKNKLFLVSYLNVIKIMENEYSIKYIDCIKIIKDWIKYKHDITISDVMEFNDNSLKIIEKEYKATLS